MTRDGIMHNALVKWYPDGSASVLVMERATIRECGWEEQGRKKAKPSEATPETPEATEAEEAERMRQNVSRAQRRAKSAVFDLAMSTGLDMFLTLTVDGSKLDRYDPVQIFGHLHDWLDNAVRRKGLAYVLVPEWHKDGALHFHALCNRALPLVDSGTMIPPAGGRPRRPRSAAQRAEWLTGGGKIVYNVPAWKWGFSTALELSGDRRAAAGYVSKYITKADKKIGGRWYYSGGDLRRPDKFTANVPWSNVTERDVFEVPELGCRAVKIWVGGNLDEALAKLEAAP